MEALRRDCDEIVSRAIGEVRPDEAVRRALTGHRKAEGKTLVVSVGKAAWSMAKAAYEATGETDGGIVITKHGYSEGKISSWEIYEAGHPVPDEYTFSATARALTMTEGLTEDDEVIFLLSGGGSALFESPLIAPSELQDITRQLLACGANIVEINTIRKRLSNVKGGRFAAHCAPAHVYAVVLSDIVGDPLDMIASGPAYPDASTCAQALAIADKYHLILSEEARACLSVETPKELHHVDTQITGSVRELCAAAARAAKVLGYTPRILTDTLDCEASEAGAFLAAVARTHAADGQKVAYIAGGETVVHLRGKGLGGRNQELALSAAVGIAGLSNVAVFSVGSDGTDGPTDAAGGFVTGETASRLAACGMDIHALLADNDSYHALSAVDGLLITGPTGTNVNDVAVVLIDA